MSLDPKLHALLSQAGQQDVPVVFLTGAGISAESGIPTFRGEEGYWTRGSQVYHPQELATWSTFSRNPQLVWPWYLYRRSVCRAAEPNAAHRVLAQLEQAMTDRFTLVTQNVDGLHLRAGNSIEKTWQIHGNIDFMRCAAGCTQTLKPVPDLGQINQNTGFEPDWKDPLTCPRCGQWMRPHVLWFDETYDEPRYRYESTQRAAASAGLLVVVGTAGATNLPRQMAQIARAKGTPIIDINPQDNPFAVTARAGRGGWIAAPATEGLAWVRDALLEG